MAPARKPAKKAGAKATADPKAKPKKAKPGPSPPRASAAPSPPAPRPSPTAASAAPRASPAAPSVAEPSFVRRAPAAERKAALEAVLDQERVHEAVQQASPAPAAAPPAPSYVKESPAALRKAAVEQLAEESGVKGALAKAPWKRASPPVAPAPALPAPAAPSSRPRVTMTKAPLESTTGRSPPKVVILDTNALMMQFQFHIDIEREVNRILNGNYEVVVPSIVVDELQRIAKEQTGKDQATARMAAELAKTFRVMDAPGEGDTGILRLAEQLNAVVVTNDKRLRATLRAKDIPNIYMRSQAFLTLEGHLPGM